MKGLLLMCLTATLLAQTWSRQRQVKVSRPLGIPMGRVVKQLSVGQSIEQWFDSHCCRLET